MRDEERRPVRRERTARALYEPQELGDVPGLLLDERGVRVEVALEELRSLEKLVEQRRGGELGGTARIVREVLAEPSGGRDRLIARGGLGRGDLLEDVAQRL